MTTSATATLRKGSRIVTTGCTSGIGLHAIRQILQTCPRTLAPPYHVILLGRETSGLAARDELRAIAAAIDEESTVDFVHCDLTWLTSVKEAGEKIRTGIKTESGPWSTIAPGRIDLVLLNAGVAKAKRNLIKTAPGGSMPSSAQALQDEEGRYEETALVNHVSQQYLLSLLLPVLLSRGLTTPRIVFTSSSLHREITSLSDLDTYFNPCSSEPKWTLYKSYSASKFLQVVGVQHLIRLLRAQLSGEKEARVEVVLVEPGFIPNTSLSRDNLAPVRFLMSYLLPWAPFATSPAQGGENIALACTRSLDAFEWVEGVERDEKWDGVSVVDGVRTAFVLKRSFKSTPDVRSEDEQLGRKWWPAVAILDGSD